MKTVLNLVEEHGYFYNFLCFALLVATLHLIRQIIRLLSSRDHSEHAAARHGGLSQSFHVEPSHVSPGHSIYSAQAKRHGSTAGIYERFRAIFAKVLAWWKGSSSPYRPVNDRLRSGGQEPLSYSMINRTADFRGQTGCLDGQTDLLNGGFSALTHLDNSLNLSPPPTPAVNDVSQPEQKEEKKKKRWFGRIKGEGKRKNFVTVGFATSDTNYSPVRTENPGQCGSPLVGGGSGNTSDSSPSWGSSPLVGGESTSARRREETLATVTAALQHCQREVQRLTSQNNSLKDRLSESAVTQFNYGPGSTAKGRVFENLSLGDNRPTALVRRFEELYSTDRLDCLDELDNHPDLNDSTKASLLLHLLLESFRKAEQKLESIHKVILQTLLTDINQLGPNPNENGPVGTSNEGIDDVLNTVSVYFQRNLPIRDPFLKDQGSSDEILKRVLQELRCPTSLSATPSLVRFVASCLSLSWALVIQAPPYTLHPESLLRDDRHILSQADHTFRDDRHTRFHSSNPKGKFIQSVVWPGLIERTNETKAMTVVLKAIVIT